MFVDRITALQGLSDQKARPALSPVVPGGSLQAYLTAVDLATERFSHERTCLLRMALSMREYSPRVQAARQAASKVPCGSGHGS